MVGSRRYGMTQHMRIRSTILLSELSNPVPLVQEPQRMDADDDYDDNDGNGNDEKMITTNRTTMVMMTVMMTVMVMCMIFDHL